MYPTSSILRSLQGHKSNRANQNRGSYQWVQSRQSHGRKAPAKKAKENTRKKHQKITILLR
jgi:hypothetical protein